MKRITYILLITLLATNCTTAQDSASNQKINITKLTAYEKGNRFFIEWSADTSHSINYWEVQRSNDGKAFSTVALVLGADPAKTTGQYTYKSKTDSRGLAEYYRVICITNSGTIQQSEIIKPVKQQDSISLANPIAKRNLPVSL